MIVLLSLQKCSICCQVLGQICDHVTGGLDACRAPGETGCGGGVDTGSVVYKILGEARVCPNFFIGEIAGQLMHDCGDHFHMTQFFSTYLGVKMEPRAKNPCAARVSGSLLGRISECANSRVPVFHEIGADGSKAKRKEAVAGRHLRRAAR